ncbi:MAG: TlpA disulfide reductase family protein, partial [Candidatus Puniceispirillaceae bacterium]
KAMVINFWASWCAPCVTELPELAEAAHILSDKKAGEEIQVVLISVDRKGADHAQAFLDERDITGVISAYNPKSDWPRHLGLRGLPATYLVSADKQDIYVINGPAAWADEAVISEIRSLITSK